MLIKSSILAYCQKTLSQINICLSVGSECVGVGAMNTVHRSTTMSLVVAYRPSSAMKDMDETTQKLVYKIEMIPFFRDVASTVSLQPGAYAPLFP